MNYEEASKIISSPEFVYARAGRYHDAHLYTREGGYAKLLGTCALSDAKAILWMRGEFLEPARW